MVDIQMDPSWLERVTPEINELIMRVTEAVCADAKQLCPVDTGALQESLTPVNAAPMEGRIISDLPYCAAIELGFHGKEWVREYATRSGHVVGAHVRQGNTPEMPFLRPALYRTRDLSEL